MATARSGEVRAELQALARRISDALPVAVEEVVLTGSVSRGVADELSDVELLVVTREALGLDDCFALARAGGLGDLDTWVGAPPPAQRVSGRRDGVPVELIVWPRAHAEARLEALLRGESPTSADALVHGIPLRTSGLLGAWQERLRSYPAELAAARIEQAVERWCGYAPAALLTVLRPGDRLALAEWLVDAATRVLTLVYALNRTWQPATKRLPARVAVLQVKPERLAERIDAAFAEPDPRRALRAMTELQLETVDLAPAGPQVDRARVWLAEALEVLR